MQQIARCHPLGIRCGQQRAPFFMTNAVERSILELGGATGDELCQRTALEWCKNLAKNGTGSLTTVPLLGGMVPLLGGKVPLLGGTGDK